METVTKDLIKAEIDHVQDEYLEVLYRIIKALERTKNADGSETWHEFIEKTYGCLSDDPIERGDQGKYEVRGTIE